MFLFAHRHGLVVGLALIAIALPSGFARSADSTLAEPVESRITSATVYPQSALVTRAGAIDAPGEYVIQSLPITIRTESVRVRAQGFEVISVDTRKRFVERVPTERLAELFARRDVLEHERKALKTNLQASQEQADFYAGILKAGPASGDQEAVPDVDLWKDGGDFLLQGLGEALKQERKIEGQLEGNSQTLADVAREIGLGSAGHGESVYDVLVSVDGSVGTRGAIEVDYLVNGAGWAPVYDLRASQKLEAVELVYRADVRQMSGEDWGDVDLTLSTANPEVGAMAPTLMAIWMGLLNVEARRRGFAKVMPTEAMGESSDWSMVSSRAARVEDAFASVVAGAGSDRFSIPRRESIPSRPDSTRVLIGRAALTTTAEHRCVPAQDENVWLRARTTNDSRWALLPGMASVYFGGDFVGRSALGRIRVGEEFDLDLGLDPRVTVERVALEKETGDGGFFSSKATINESWRLRFAVAPGTGRVHIVVQEVLPKSRNADLEIELDFATPALSGAERWQAERDEKGFLTWELDLDGGREAVIEWGLQMTYPEKMEVAR